jgi:glycosyltransferase involved in cell wall biosynthesis/ubiquinone/menaquinone biosynthesis C-methylase UbiE
LRFLFVSWRDLANPRAGGSEVVVDRLASRLQARGHDVTLLAGGPVGERAYPVVDNGGTYSQYLTAPLQYARHFRDADVVVDVVNGMPFFSPLWRHKARVCLLFHVHADQWDRYFPPPVARSFRALEARGLPAVYRDTPFLTISRSSADDLVALGVAPERITTLELGADIDPAVAVAKSPTPLFVALGRLAPNKRLDLLLDHWAKVGPLIGGRLVLVGDGPERAHLEARLRHDKALATVELAGRVDEARKTELLQQAWLLVHTADHEGWGLVIAEAGRCGTPALAYDVGGVRDAIVDRETGVLVRSDDELTTEWIALASDEARRDQLGTAARARASEFSWDHTVDQLLAVAERAVSPAHHPLAEGPTHGVPRSAHLLRLFAKEQTDPDRFYHYLAADTVRHVRRYADPNGAIAVDIGGGPGYVAEALKTAGAHCMVVEYDVGELALHDRTPDVAVQGDGQAVPLRDGSAQLVHSSNVLEHVPDWRSMLSEMVRVLEPGRGVGYLTFTPWYSPWGGHETSPWHYLGGDRAVARYTEKHGRPPKNEYGRSLHRLLVSEVVDWFEARDDVEILWVGPRYLPSWVRKLVDVPIAREVVTWNVVVVFRRRPEPVA